MAFGHKKNKENIIGIGELLRAYYFSFSLHKISGSVLEDPSQITILYLFIGFVRACKKFVEPLT